ncbi:MAG: YigZ family protein [Chloroflexi bacterium]|nr:YigZ family protein [Chloroflexota bacterium]
MPTRYPVPTGVHRVAEEIQRSRFITTVAYAPSVKAARAFIAEMKVEFADASHNCWAYVVGPPGSSGQIGYSDDGEPHGTAGRPMFTVLQHCGLGDITAVVTRYFGGTKLGKGGLVRAYSSGVQYALEALPTREYVPTVDMVIVIAYSHVTPVQRLLPDYEAEVVAEEYAIDVSYRLRLPVEQAPRLHEALVGLTQGAVLVEMEPTSPNKKTGP